MIPAKLDLDSIVAIDHRSLDVEQLVDVVATCGTKLVYLNRTTVDGEDLASWVEDELFEQADDELAMLQDQLRRVDGWVEELEIGFAHAGLMHCWTARTPWADYVDDLREVSRNRGLRDRDDETRWTPPERLSEDRINELAAELTAQPDFRRATRTLDKEDAARSLPSLAELYNRREGRWDIHRVLRTAADLIEREREECCARLEAKKDELAEGLAADAEYRRTGTTEARRKYAGEWIRVHHSNGLPMPRALAHELVHIAKSLRDRPMF